MRRIYLPGMFGVLLLTAGMALGQATSGDLTGKIVDETGAVIAGATVEVTNVDTGVTTTITGSSAGDIRISNLLPGNYNVSASAQGFAVYTLKNVRIDLNKRSNVTLTLAPSGSNSSVDVSAEAAANLDTTSTNLTQTFGTQELSTLPSATTGLNGVLNVSLLSPNVASTGGIGIGAGPSVGGQRPRNNNFTLEGIDNNDKSLTGPLINVPNDAVGEFSLITNQFSPEFGHSSGGQFNVNVIHGTNKFHGKVYEYFQNRNLNAENASAGQKIPNPGLDDNRYGAQLGGPILNDKLFFFVNFERHTTNSVIQNVVCVPTVAGFAQLNAVAGAYNLNANNLSQLAKYTPAVTNQVDAANDGACFNQPTGPQTIAIYSDTAKQGILPYAGVSTQPVFGSQNRLDIPVGNFNINGPSKNLTKVLTTSADWTISPKDSLRVRYLYSDNPRPDTFASLPAFYTPQPFISHLATLSEFHTFTANLTNEVRLGVHRFLNPNPAGSFTYPGLTAFPNLLFIDQGQINYGPDTNTPASTIENLYQFTDNISWTKGKHTFTIGFDGRKAISPQQFTQRQRGDYEYNYLTEFLHDLAPTSLGERSTGNFTYYGDQTSFYGYANDIWRATAKVTFNYGLRYEFTSVPVGERQQQLNAAASVPGLIDFHAPQPQYKNFAPRIGVNFAPDEKTSIRAAFGMSYDVLFDNLGTLSAPPQLSATNDVGNVGQPQPGDPNFLAKGGLAGGVGTGIKNFDGDLVAQRAATAGFLPDQRLPYAETWSLGIQRVFGANYTGEIRYLGTRGIHLPTQTNPNIQAKVTAANQLPTSLTGSTSIATSPTANTLANLEALSEIVPAYQLPAPDGTLQGFTSRITAYLPSSESNYNALSLSLQRRFQHGFLLNAAYTWSKTMDDATAEVFSTTLTPRRPQDSQNLANDYSRSALDRTHRLTIAAVYELPYFKHSNWLMKNAVGNWVVSPIYTYESPAYATALSGVNSNLNGDSSTIDRPIINPNGVKGTGSGVAGVYSTTLASKCGSGITQCDANLVGYVATNPNAYYIEAGAGTLPTAGRNTLPIRPIDNVDLTLSKRLNITEGVTFEFQAMAFNALNHPQYLPGSLNGVETDLSAQFLSTQFQTVSNPSFNHPEKEFKANARGMQLATKISF
ncbi:carboxypeptidase regulatory-like domain-containing protein [Granulicella sp. dw_53]|uniref:TonB-dependent receptor n=1 Tax=Granulicella sp. dw_53 TaxID=2719792 RepID=UPI001BD35BCA|nr:carboxypeptidase regulatory-like domain-containing protein [Granulicella sp. dw_53]